MILRADGPVGSGQTYRVTEVNGRIPDILDDFAGGYAELVLHKDGDACRVVGEGIADDNRRNPIPPEAREP